MSVRQPILLIAMLVASGCGVTTQLGAECSLVRKATTQEQQTLGVDRIFVTEAELVAGQDYVSFGSLDCDQLELTCVRDANHPRKTTPGSPDAAATDAKGYCSQACVETSACDLTEGEEVAPGLEGRTLTCRSLALDSKALEELKRSDPIAYRQTFGENSSASFCVTPLPVPEQP